MTQDGVELVNLNLPKGVWTRQVVGIGNYSPGTLPVNFIALRSTAAGYDHYCLDHIVIHRNDGGIRSVIWSSDSSFAPLLYRYRGGQLQRTGGCPGRGRFPVQ